MVILMNTFVLWKTDGIVSTLLLRFCIISNFIMAWWGPKFDPNVDLSKRCLGAATQLTQFETNVYATKTLEKWIYVFNKLCVDPITSRRTSFDSIVNLDRRIL